MSSVVTFYSFKGGVGRTMALANIAVLLVRSGKRVLAVDWDLEAPGLDRYFADCAVARSPNDVGLIELLTGAFDAGSAESAPDWRQYLAYVDVGSSQKNRPGSVPAGWDDFKTWRRLDPQRRYPLALMRSGREDEEYASRVLGFDWSAFFSERDGGQFVERLREDWLTEFDVTLVDSRTGITDSGGVCTIQLPDVLVPVFTTTKQSLLGAKNIAERAQHARQQLVNDRTAMTVFPLASRFDSRAQYAEAREWLQIFARELAPFYADWLPTKPVEITPYQVIEKTKIPYVAYFSFGEKLPVVTESLDDPEGLPFAYSQAATLIAGDFQNVEELFGHASSMRRKLREERLEAQARRQRWMRRVRAGAFAALAAIVLFAVTTWMFPPHSAFVVTDSAVLASDARWIVAQDHRTAVAFVPNGRSRMWTVGTPITATTDIGVKFHDIILSPLSGYAAGITPEGHVYVWPARAALSVSAKPLLSIRPRTRSWGGFSNDERWLYVTSNGGDVFVVSLSPDPQVTAMKFDQHSRVEFAPRATFSPHGRWFAACAFFRLVDLWGIDRLRAIRLAVPGSGRTPHWRVASNDAPECTLPVFSEHDAVFSVTSPGGGVDVYALSGDGKRPFAHLSLPRTDFLTPTSDAISPDASWLVARHAYGDFYALPLSGPNLGKAMQVTASPSSGGDSAPSITFSDDSEWVAGVGRDQSIYVWRLRESARGNLTATVPATNGTTVPLARFIPRSQRVVAVSTDGNVYTLRPGESTLKSTPVQHLDVRPAELAFDADAASGTLAIVAGSALYYGSSAAGAALPEVFRGQEPIHTIAVSPDRSTLIVIAEHGLTFLQRKLYFWGLPIRSETLRPLVNVSTR